MTWISTRFRAWRWSLSTARINRIPTSEFPASTPSRGASTRRGYRGRLWTKRQFAGFGGPHDTNERYKFLIDQGQTGLSVAFDMPTLMGRDSDEPHSEGEVGRCGVAVDSLADMEILFADIDLEEITTSMTISGPAPMLFAMYLAAADKAGRRASPSSVAPARPTSSRSTSLRRNGSFHPSPTSA